MFKTQAIPELSDVEKRRFWDKVEKRPNGCWKWTGSTKANRCGVRYGEVWIRRHVYLVHRVSWRIFHGQIPEGMVVDHRCHNTLCVNPGHLHVVTQMQNMENIVGQYHRKNRKNDVPRSGFRGVSWDKKYAKWKVKASHCGKDYYGGRYTDVNEANRAAIALRDKLMTNNLGDR